MSSQNFDIELAVDDESDRVRAFACISRDLSFSKLSCAKPLPDNAVWTITVCRKQGIVSMYPCRFERRTIVIETLPKV